MEISLFLGMIFHRLHKISFEIKETLFIKSVGHRCIFFKLNYNLIEKYFNV